MARPIREILDYLIENGTIDKHRNSSIADLAKEWVLPEEQASDLHYLISAHFDPDHLDPYKHLQIFPAKLIVEGAVEALHAGIDGPYSEHDRIVIERFLADLCLYAREAKE